MSDPKLSPPSRHSCTHERFTPLMLVALTILGCRGAESTRPGGPPPPTTGTIAGTVLSTLGAVDGAAVHLISSTGAAVRDTIVGSVGAFQWTDILAGSYGVRVQLPPGYSARQPTDTMKQVVLPAGGRADVVFSVIADTISSGVATPAKPETLSVYSGAMATVVAPATLPSLSTKLATDASMVLPAGRQPVSLGATLTIDPAGVSGARAVLDGTASYTVSLSFRVNSRDYSASCPPQIYYELFDFSRLRISSATATADLVADSRNPAQSYATLQISPPAGALHMVRGRVLRTTCTCAGNYRLSSWSGDSRPIAGLDALILVHGIELQRSACEDFDGFDPASDYFAPLIADLANDDAISRRFKIYTFKYPSFLGVEAAASALQAGIAQQLPGVKLEILGHSMGGLVARRAMALGQLPVMRLITLATPNLGTLIADPSVQPYTSGISACYDANASRVGALPWWAYRPASNWVLHQQVQLQGVRDLAPNNPLLTRLAAIDPNVTIALGGRVKTSDLRRDHDAGTISGLLHFSCVIAGSGQAPTGDDTTVPLASALPSGQSPLGTVFSGLDHLDMALNSSFASLSLFNRIRELLLVSGADPCIAPTVVLPISLTGSLTGLECSIGGAPTILRAVQISAQSGLRLSMTSYSFPPLVWVVPSGGLDYLGTYSTSGSVNRKWIVPPGSYSIGFGSHDPSGSGPYGGTAKLESPDINTCESANLISLSQTLGQNLAYGDCADSGWYYDEFTIYSRQPCTIDMQSSGVDAYLEVYNDDGSLLQWDDDSGGGKNARISRSACVTAPATDGFAGIRVRATSYFAGESGPYSLVIQFANGASLSVTGESGTRTLLPGAAYVERRPAPSVVHGPRVKPEPTR